MTTNRWNHQKRITMLALAMALSVASVIPAMAQDDSLSTTDESPYAIKETARAQSVPIGILIFARLFWSRTVFSGMILLRAMR